MLVAFHRVHGRRSAGLVLRVRLRDGHGVLNGGGERQPLQSSVASLRAGLLNGRVNFHRPAILPAARTTGDEHLPHQFVVAEKLLHERTLRRSLLCKLRQPSRRRLGQNHAAHELRIELVVRDHGIHVREQRLDRAHLRRARRGERRLRCVVRLRELRLIGLRFVQHLLPFFQRLQSRLFVRLPLREVFVPRLALRIRRRAFQRRLRCRDSLRGATQPLPLRVLHEGFRGIHRTQRLRRIIGFFLRGLGCCARFFQRGAFLLRDRWQRLRNFRLQRGELRVVV